MVKKKLSILAAIVMLVSAALACSGSVSTAKITSAKMSADSEGTSATTTFSPDQTFYAIVELANAPSDTKLKAVWTAVEVEGEQPDLLIDEAEITAGDQNVFTFNLSNDGLWPAGKYKVDIYLNDKLDQTLEFQVQ
jgi:hypothetical protein